MPYQVYLTTPVNTYSYRCNNRPTVISVLNAIINDLPCTPDLDCMLDLIIMHDIPTYTNVLTYTPGYSIRFVLCE